MNGSEFFPERFICILTISYCDVTFKLTIKQLFNRFSDIRRDEMKRVYNLDGLDCANCAAKIENALNARDDVISASVSFMTQKLTLEIADDAFDKVLPEIRALIRKVDSDIEVNF